MPLFDNFIDMIGFLVPAFNLDDPSQWEERMRQCRPINLYW